MPFKPEPSIAWVPVVKEQLVAVVESINQPQVSIPGKEPQAVQGFLCGLRNSNGTFSIYVSLFLAKSQENVVYASDRREVGVEEYREVEIEGLHFLESMGFMLDNVNYTKLSPEAQEQTLRRVPLLHRQRPAAPPAASDARTSPKQALIRLLAGF